MITHRPNSTSPSLPPDPFFVLETLSDSSLRILPEFILPSSVLQNYERSVRLDPKYRYRLSVRRYPNLASSTEIAPVVQGGHCVLLFVLRNQPTRKPSNSPSISLKGPDLVYRPNLDSSQPTPARGQSPLNQIPTSCVLP